MDICVNINDKPYLVFTIRWKCHLYIHIFIYISIHWKWFYRVIHIWLWRRYDMSDVCIQMDRIERCIRAGWQDTANHNILARTSALPVFTSSSVLRSTEYKRFRSASRMHDWLCSISNAISGLVKCRPIYIISYRTIYEPQHTWYTWKIYKRVKKILRFVDGEKILYEFIDIFISTYVISTHRYRV